MQRRTRWISGRYYAEINSAKMYFGLGSGSMLVDVFPAAEEVVEDTVLVLVGDEAAALEQLLGQTADVAGAAKSGPVQPMGDRGSVSPVGQMVRSALRTPTRAFAMPSSPAAGSLHLG
ncbi:hypothetical protein JK2ML_1057 [Mycobacterium leprae Kyoto-2]|uniref:Uncharacterized protein n=3 Tax=Mycobacterium leprae TaxID=1769 RepID=Q7AQA0_MYCLE|nr:hypothetical protein [Mycobacterium leprae]CAR71152.1 hypothetical protein MLBr01057 [Mycobacterium leprae Br4923]AAA62901.1 u1756e [Mycobacterium leprae]AWV47738.1 hypothetical protein DIJ64_05610 [Mycobacterium leprae]OAR20280.1 hypothetical protein A8144_11760 [Mycobacterium leprae 3125609]OAX70582.1 hypothetical protein A3216_11050 [Mycobacterium leprae 7935681]